MEEELEEELKKLEDVEQLEEVVKFSLWSVARCGASSLAEVLYCLYMIMLVRRNYRRA